MNRPVFKPSPSYELNRFMDNEYRLSLDGEEWVPVNDWGCPAIPHVDGYPMDHNDMGEFRIGGTIDGEAVPLGPEDVLPNLCELYSAVDKEGFCVVWERPEDIDAESLRWLSEHHGLGVSHIGGTVEYIRDELEEYYGQLFEGMMEVES